MPPKSSVAGNFDHQPSPSPSDSLVEAQKATKTARKAATAGPSTVKRKTKSSVDEEPVLVPVATFDQARGRQPEKEETVRAVTHFLKVQFSDRVERHRSVQTHVANNRLSNLKIIQHISEDARRRDEMPNLARENDVWRKFSDPRLQKMLVALAKDPNGFKHKRWETKGILQRCNDDLEPEEGKVHFYLRSRIVPLEVAQSEDSAFLRSHPVNLGFVMARKWSMGLAEDSLAEMKEVLGILGFEDAALDIPPSPAFERPKKVRYHYAGTTLAKNPGKRAKQDATQKGNTSLHLNLVSQENQEYPWVTWRIIPLTQDVEGPLAIRQDRTLGDIETVLISLLPLSSNSQPGGHQFDVSFDTHIAKAMHALVNSLPDPTPVTSDPILQRRLTHAMETMRELFSSMREAELNVGKAVSERSFNNSLRELCDRIRVINGEVTMMTVMKDTPAEVQSGRVDGALFDLSTEVGHGIRLHRNIINFLFDDSSQFERLGPHLNFWEIIVIHLWWGCLVLLVGRFIRILNPLVLHTHSMVVNGVMTSPELVRLAREFPDGMELTVDTISSSRLMEMQAPAEVRDFVDKVGVLKLIKTGPMDHQKSILASNYDPGATSYHAMLRKHETRLMAIVTSKEMALDRVAEAFAGDERFVDDRDGLLNAVIAEVEKLCDASGINEEMELCRAEVKLMKKGLYAFSSKKIEDGRVVRTGQGASRIMTNINFGIRAQGEPYSKERNDQLAEVTDDYQNAASSGLAWTLKGPKSSLPGSPDFDLWFLSRGINTSLRQSSNHYAQSTSNNTPAQIASLVENTHSAAVQRRETQIAVHGSWRRAEFLEKAEAVFNLALAFRGKAKPFTETLRIAKCLACGTLAIGYGRNASHLCTHTLLASQARKLVIGMNGETSEYEGYLVLLHIHNVVEYPGIYDYLSETTLGDWGIFSSPAADFLVDGRGNLLENLPSCLGNPGIRGQQTLIFHREDTHVNVCVAAAVDVLLKQNTSTPPCWSFDGPSQGSHWNSTTFNAAVKVLLDAPSCFEVRICRHPGCGHTRLEHKDKRKSNKHKHGSVVPKYRSYIPTTLLEIPYFFTRLLVYKALVENDKDCAHAMMKLDA